MPKKLAQLARDVYAISTDYEEQMSEFFRIKDDLSKHSSRVLGEKQDKLKQRIDLLMAKGENGDTVGRFYKDPTAKKLIDDLDAHKEQLYLLFSEYWKARNKLYQAVLSTDTVLKRTDAIIADKQNQWFSSGSLANIKAQRNYLAALRPKIRQIVLDLEPGIPKPDDLPPALKPGWTNNIRITTLTERYKIAGVDGFINYFNKARAAECKSQTARWRETAEGLAQIAKENSEI